MIQAHQLTKRYGDKTAVHTLSFTIAPGTVTGFLGPNGAGKSTTMRLIMGLDRPTSGTVTVNGKPYGQHRSPLREVSALLDAKTVQIAKAFGGRVTGVCGAAKVDMVRSIGADHVIDYTREDFADAEQRYEVILDIGGSSSLSRLRRALTLRGTLVIVGGEGGGRWLGIVGRLLRAHLLFPFVSQKLGTFISSENHEDLIVLKDLIESGKLTPVIDRTYPLAEVPEAVRYLEEGHARGKVVISVSGEPKGRLL